MKINTSAYLYLSAALCAFQGSLSFVKTLQRLVSYKKTTDNLMLCSSVSKNITYIFVFSHTHTHTHTVISFPSYRSISVNQAGGGGEGSYCKQTNTSGYKPPGYKPPPSLH